jgi:hypothetical protein
MEAQVSHYVTNTSLWTTSTTTTTNIYDVVYPDGFGNNHNFVYRPSQTVPTPPFWPVAEGAAIPEGDLEWLKRRVNEMSWIPA